MALSTRSRLWALSAVLSAVLLLCALQSSAASARSGQLPMSRLRRNRPYEKAPIAQLLEDKKRNLPVLWDPMKEVAIFAPPPDSDPHAKFAAEQLKLDGATKDSVSWLDSHEKSQRDMLGRMFDFCSNMYASMGADRNCIVQCHPKLDCGEQGARECQPWKDNYEEFIKCSDRERKFCQKYGAFNSEKFPNFKKATFNSPSARMENIVTYCGNLFQWRGMKLPCLHACTIFQMRETQPDQYFAWKARSRIREFRGMKDPSDEIMADPDYAAFNECESQAVNLCKFLQRDYWRECYEKQKMTCLRNAGNWNDMLADS